MPRLTVAAKAAAAEFWAERTFRARERLGAHMSDPAKRYEIRWVPVLDCRPEENMVAVEERLIARYKPRLNVLGVGR